MMSEQTLPWTSLEDSTYCYSAAHRSNDEYYPEPPLLFSTSSSLSSGSGSPADMIKRSPSPVDARTKNARAQARHRAKRKAYIENLETSVRQLRIAVTSGLSPEAAAQAQLLERENARLRAEAQYLRSQLGVNAGPLTAPMSSSWSGPSHAVAIGQNGNTGRTVGVRLPSIAGTLGALSSTRTSPSLSSYPGQPRLRSAHSADNLRIRRSPDDRRRRAAPYAPIDSARRDIQRQSSQSDYQYTPRQFHAQEADTSGSLDGSPFVHHHQQSPQASSYSSSTLADAFGQMSSSTNATYSYPIRDDQRHEYDFQHQQYGGQDDGTVYSETAIIAPQAQPGYPPLSEYTASTFGLCATYHTGSPEDVKPIVH